jgi:hypothetical protein
MLSIDLQVIEPINASAFVKCRLKYQNLSEESEIALWNVD